LPEVRRSVEIKKPGENKPLFLASSFFLLALLLSAGAFLYINSLRNQVTSLDVIINNLENDRDKKAEEKVLKVKEQLKIASQLLDNHPIWSSGLARLQNKTSPLIKYQNIDASLDDFDFKAVAPSYSAVARQIAGYLSEDSIKDVQITQLKSLTTGQVEFLAAIFFDKSKFLLNKK